MPLLSSSCIQRTLKLQLPLILIASYPILVYYEDVIRIIESSIGD